MSERFRPLDEVVREHVLAVLEACDWSKARAAAVLKIAVKSVYNHVNRAAEAGLIEWADGHWRRTGKAGTP